MTGWKRHSRTSGPPPRAGNRVKVKSYKGTEFRNKEERHMNVIRQTPEIEQDPQSKEQPRKQPVTIPARPARRSRRGIVILLVVAVLAGAGFFVWKQFFATSRVP